MGGKPSFFCSQNRPELPRISSTDISEHQKHLICKNLGLPSPQAKCCVQHHRLPNGNPLRCNITHQRIILRGSPDGGAPRRPTHRSNPTHFGHKIPEIPRRGARGAPRVPPTSRQDASPPADTITPHAPHASPNHPLHPAPALSLPSRPSQLIPLPPRPGRPLTSRPPLNAFLHR